MIEGGPQLTSGEDIIVSIIRFVTERHGSGYTSALLDSLQKYNRSKPLMGEDTATMQCLLHKLRPDVTLSSTSVTRFLHFIVLDLNRTVV